MDQGHDQDAAPEEGPLTVDGHPPDVVVIGSGFGGAVAACRAAEAGLRVLVLERGRRWPPGTFARSPRDMARNLWEPDAGLHGVFDIWSFARMDAVVAAGVGGGSLIYANVTLPMPKAWFETTRTPWPVDYDDFAKYYPAVEQELGVTRAGPEVVKSNALAGLSEGWYPRRVAPLAVTLGSRPGERFGDPADNPYGVERRTCRLCGECDIGCNDGAKNTLDLTYLWRAQRAGARVVERCHVRDVTDLGDGGYLLRLRRFRLPEHPWVRSAPAAPLEVDLRAPVVVVAAGALGSTWLLLRSRRRAQSHPGLGLGRLDDTLGLRFSGNGDALGLMTRGREPIEASTGPVITGYAEVPGAGGAGPHIIEDGGYPLFLAWMGEALSPGMWWRTARMVAARAWHRARGSNRSNIGLDVARIFGSSRAADIVPLLGMGMDENTGRLYLDRGRLQLDWDPRASRPYVRRVMASMDQVAAANGARLLSLSKVLSRGITAHPLGGCPMGDPGQGVAGITGEVHGHEGLFVCDGSVLPGPVGANPSMTIAAVAEMFAPHIIHRAEQRKGRTR